MDMPENRASSARESDPQPSTKFEGIDLEARDSCDRM
jgi:hypothetical protein